mgnify:CR=1 FL=1
MKKKSIKLFLFMGFLLFFTFGFQQTDISNPNVITINNSIYSFLGITGSTKENPKPDILVIPGGHSIGVTLQTKGVLVVGYAPIINEEGKEIFPAKEAGIVVGDTILSVNGKKALSDFQVAQEINKSCQENKQIVVEVQKKKEIQEKIIEPVYCAETQRFRIGLYIRDEAAGVGTLTFIEPETKIFGALGHVITDTDTNNKIEMNNGKILESTIYGIEKGKKGDPGEKIGGFLLESSFLGRITNNSSSGIFGVFDKQINNPFFTKPIPIAWKNEIKTGKATIYTVLKNNNIQEFEVNIEKIMPYRNDNKNMIIKITDPKLLEITGGIVQGMSGSPIVQNGKIVGAITHVFVNDSTRGYGIFIERMLEESGILNQKTALKGSFSLGLKIFLFFLIPKKDLNKYCRRIQRLDYQNFLE